MAFGRLKSHLLAVAVAITVFLLDFASKFLTNLYIPRMGYDSLWYPYGGIGIFKNFLGIEFSISHAINFGAAWGLGGEYQLELLLLRVVLVVGLIIYLVFFNQSRPSEIPLVLIITGALANIVDYFIYGHVVDMFHFVLWGYEYPVFNVADSAIFLGVASLLILSWFPAAGAPAKAAGSRRKK